MYITFGSAESGQVGPTIGPFPYVVMTYNMLRIGDDRGDAYTLATVHDTGLWIIGPDNSARPYVDPKWDRTEWTDVTIHSEVV